MAIAFKFANDNGNFGSSIAVAYGGANTLHDTGIVSVGWDFSGGVTLNSITDSVLNPYFFITSIALTGGKALAVYYSPNLVAHAAPTVTAKFSGNVDAALAVDSYSGLANVSPVDTWAIANGTSATPSVGPVTPRTANSLVLGFFNGSSTVTNGGSWNLRDNAYASGTQSGLVEDQILTSNSTQSPNATMTSGAWVAIALVLSDTNLSKVATARPGYFPKGPLTMGPWKPGAIVFSFPPSVAPSTATATPSGVDTEAVFGAGTFVAGQSTTNTPAVPLPLPIPFGPLRMGPWSPLPAPFSFSPAAATSTGTVTPAGIDADTLFGAGTFAAGLSSAISPSEAMGADTLAGVVTSSAPSAEAFGAPTEASALTGAVPTGEAFGAGVGAGVVTSSAGPAEGSGAPTIAGQVTTAGIPTDERTGAPTSASALEPAGLPTFDAFGSPSLLLVSVIDPASIEPQERFGAPTMAAGVTSSVPPEERAGAHTTASALSGAVPPSEAQGAPTLLSVFTVTPASIAPDERFGALTIASDISSSVPTDERYGAPTWRPAVFAVGIQTNELFGAPTLAALVPSFAFPASIATGEIFGAFHLVPVVVLPPGVVLVVSSPMMPVLPVSTPRPPVLTTSSID